MKLHDEVASGCRTDHCVDVFAKELQCYKALCQTHSPVAADTVAIIHESKGAWTFKADSLLSSQLD